MSTEDCLTEEQQETLVHGYIRRHEYLVMNLIPIAIINVFVTWYKSSIDQWSADESSAELYIEDKILMNEVDVLQWLNAFGTHSIGNGEKKIWKLRVNSIINSKSSIISARIGIIDSAQVEHDKDIQSFHFTKLIMKRNSSRKHSSFDQDVVSGSAMSGISGNFWYWLNPHKRLNKLYAQPLHDNDIIIMELDLMDTNCLKYKINGIHFGIALKNINSTKQYKLAVALSRKESVTILQ